MRPGAANFGSGVKNRGQTNKCGQFIQLFRVNSNCRKDRSKFTLRGCAGDSSYWPYSLHLSLPTWNSSLCTPRIRPDSRRPRARGEPRRRPAPERSPSADPAEADGDAATPNHDDRKRPLARTALRFVRGYATSDSYSTLYRHAAGTIHYPLYTHSQSKTEEPCWHQCRIPTLKMPVLWAAMRMS